MLTARIDALLPHPAREIREAVVSRYERLGAPLLVVSRSLVEPDAELRLRLARMAIGHAPTIVRTLDEATARVLLAGELPYDALVAFASRASLRPDDAAVVLAGLERAPEAPIELLFALANRSWGSMAHIERLLDRCVVVTTELRELLLACRRQLATVLDVDPDDSYPPTAEHLASVQRVVDRIDSLLAGH